MRLSLFSTVLTVVSLAAAGPASIPRLVGRANGRHQVSRALEIRVPVCNADNCARAVTGTQAGAAAATVRTSDCQSFFRYTVTPARSTTTVTSTVVVAQASSTQVAAGGTSFINSEEYTGRNTPSTVSPTNVPAYASACSGSARYSSACSCLGVSSSTVTASTPVVTATVYRTRTTSVSGVATYTSIAIVVDPIPCGQTVTGEDGSSIAVVCEATGNNLGSQLIEQEIVSTWDACLGLADDNARATSFTFEIQSGQCTLFHDTVSNAGNTPASGAVYGYFPQ